MKFREPILIGLLVFFGMLIAGALGHVWEEALTAAITIGAIVWVVQSKGSKQAKKLADPAKKLRD